MEKPAQTDHPIHDLITRRWSPRAFAERPVDSTAVLSLLEAARWAASCYNDQPWAFIVASREEPEAHRRLLSCLVEANRTWAARAPVLMLSVARHAFDHNSKPNRHALHDVGQAVANMAIQATSLGLFVHQMGGFDAARARELFAIPQGWEPVAAIAIGHGDRPEVLPEALRERETADRNRRPLREFVFSGRWGDICPLLPPNA